MRMGVGVTRRGEDDGLTDVGVIEAMPEGVEQRNDEESEGPSEARDHRPFPADPLCTPAHGTHYEPRAAVDRWSMLTLEDPGRHAARHLYEP